MSNHPDDYIKPELMACCGAREIRDGDIVVVGTGFPAMSANIARYTHAPGAMLMQESGVFDARPTRPALSVGDPCLNPGAAMTGGLVDVMGMFLQGGWVDVGFLAGSQIDKYGNINTTVIGEYEKPKNRLPGSGGANDLASLAWRISSSRLRIAEACEAKADTSRASSASRTGPHRTSSVRSSTGVRTCASRTWLTSKGPLLARISQGERTRSRRTMAAESIPNV